MPRDSAERKTWSRFPFGDHAKNRKVIDMYYVYVLHSAEYDRLYVGSSAKPDERLKSHNAGRVKSTKAFRPWARIHLEEHPDRNVEEKSGISSQDGDAVGSRNKFRRDV